MHKKSEQKATEKGVAQKNEVEGMNHLDLSRFSTLLIDEKNVAGQNPISPHNLIVHYWSSMNHSNAQVLESALFTTVLISIEKLRLLKKSLDFAPVQGKINESELRSDFEDFCRRLNDIFGKI